jgi:formiminoglutamase
VDLRDISHLRPAERPPDATHADPNFHRATEAIADVVSDPVAVVLGAPFAGASLSKAACDEAPAAVRAALVRFSAYSSEAGAGLEIASVLDAGDVTPAGEVVETQERIAAVVEAVSAVPVALLGGDNSVTVGGARGASCDGLLTFDAHHDVRDGISNGSPVRQLIEAGMEGSRIVQIGIHGFANSAAYAERARKAGIAWFVPAEVRARGIAPVVKEALDRIVTAGARRVWVDFDLDVLDRAFAPGTAASVPGGLWPADLEQAALMLGGAPVVAGIDLTELDPTQDVGEVTVRTACAVLMAFLVGVASR